YGLVDHKDADFNNALLGNNSASTINAAKSSGCKTLSLLPSVKFKSLAISVAIVLGVKVITRMLFFLTSFIKDSDMPITANFEAEYAEVVAFPFNPAVEEIFIMSPLF